MRVVFDFIYKATIVKREDGKIEVTSYNSPYVSSQNTQSIDDIKYAIEKLKIINPEELETGREYYIELLCRFVQNEDKSFDQIFKLEKIK